MADRKIKLELTYEQAGMVLASLRIASERLNEAKATLASLRIASERLNGAKATLAMTELNLLVQDLREQIEDTRPKACPGCLGFGYVAYFGQQVDCPDCRGTGRVNHA